MSHDRYAAGRRDRYAAGRRDRYAAGRRDRYAAGRRDRYAAGRQDRYAAGQQDRYAASDYLSRIVIRGKLCTSATAVVRSDTGGRAGQGRHLNMNQ